MCVCVCVCVTVFDRFFKSTFLKITCSKDFLFSKIYDNFCTHTHTHTHIYIYIYIYMPKWILFVIINDQILKH